MGHLVANPSCHYEVLCPVLSLRRRPLCSHHPRQLWPPCWTPHSCLRRRRPDPQGPSLACLHCAPCCLPPSCCREHRCCPRCLPQRLRCCPSCCEGCRACGGEERACGRPRDLHGAPGVHPRRLLRRCSRLHRAADQDCRRRPRRPVRRQLRSPHPLRQRYPSCCRPCPCCCCPCC